MGGIDYHIIRSKRKSLALEISNGPAVLVRAPYGVSEAHIAGFVQQHSAWIEKKLAARRAFLDKHPEPMAQQLEDWMALAQTVVPGRVAHYAAVMGLMPTGIRFTKNKTRVGSCCKKNQLSFSCRLMGYPPEVLDYVVVHELAHILHKNHGPAFWRAVEAVLPDYRKRRAMLRV